MFAKTFRGSLFMTLMLIVSISLTGCGDIGAIFSGLQNVIGNIGGKLGEFITKGVDFAKDFIGKAKDFVEPLIEKGKEIFEEIQPIAEKITNGIDQVEEVVDNVSNVGDSVQDFTNAISGSGQDSAGDEIDPDAPTQEVIANPDSEDAEIVISPEENDNPANTGNNTAEDEVVTDSELQQQAQTITENVNAIADGADQLAEEIQNLDISSGNRDELMSKVGSIKDNIEKILEDPTSDEAKALFEQSKNDIESIANEAQQFGDNIQNTIEAVQDVFDEAGDSIDQFSDAMNSLFG